jgi:hypothetical protein
VGTDLFTSAVGFELNAMMRGGRVRHWYDPLSERLIALKVERAMRGVTLALSACRRPLHRRLAESGKAYCVTAAIARN